MNEQEKKLWELIQKFELDDPSSSFMFSDRLARENDWKVAYALRAIQEYKKFMFLLCIAPHSLTPSDQIDQVWHLHLLYTQSYWIDFCKDTLGREIHHGPTRGREERGTFTNQYQACLDLYADKFGQEPPKDIWPAEEDRFTSIHFSRVNRDTHWVIPKFKFLRS